MARCLIGQGHTPLPLPPEVHSPALHPRQGDPVGLGIERQPSGVTDNVNPLAQQPEVVLLDGAGNLVPRPAVQSVTSLLARAEVVPRPPKNATFLFDTNFREEKFTFDMVTVLASYGTVYHLEFSLAPEEGLGDVATALSIPIVPRRCERSKYYVPGDTFCRYGPGPIPGDALEGRVAPEAVRSAVGGGCQSGWGRLLSVTNAIEAGTCRSGDSGWA